MKVNMKVYHLEVQANSTRYGELIENNSYYSDVFSTLKKAINEGKDFLERRIRILYENSGYCVAEDENPLTIQDMINDGEIYYTFTVTEINPEYADSFRIPDAEYKCRDLEPTHIKNYYNMYGKLKYSDIEYRGPWSYVIRRYPGDDENKPNKFKIGDFVTVKNSYLIPEGQLCIVNQVPERNNPERYFENTYTVSTILDNNWFGYCYDFNESELEPYKGKIDKDGPFEFLRKIYTNEIQIDKETLRKIEDNEIILNLKPTYKEMNIGK